MNKKSSRLSLKEIVPALGKPGKSRFTLLMGLALISLVLPTYLFRELFAAEVLFAVAFMILIAVCGSFYLIGAIGEHALQFVVARAHGRINTAQVSHAVSVQRSIHY
jgi:hypothetical protein